MHHNSLQLLKKFSRFALFSITCRKQVGIDRSGIIQLQTE